MEVFDRGVTRTYYTRPMLSAPPESATSVLIEPLVIDAQVLAHSGLVWEYTFNDRRFPRLHDMALSDTPVMVARLQFAILAAKPVIHGQVHGTVEVVCQRCMQPMQQRVDERFDLMVIDSEAELEQVPESLEAWIVNASRLDAAALIEEQVLLALPLIAKHDEGQPCVAVMSAVNEPRVVAAQTLAVDSQRPFANLRELLSK